MSNQKVRLAIKNILRNFFFMDFFYTLINIRYIQQIFNFLSCIFLHF